MSKCKVFYLLIETSNGSAVMEVVRSADIHEFFFQATKSSDMEFVELQGSLLAESQEWHFQVLKLSDNCNNIPQESGFVDVHV